MMISLRSCFFFGLYVATFSSIVSGSVSSQCQSDQQEFLLGFKNSIDSSSSEKLATWNESTDCCSWDGITCDATGRVFKLELNVQSISGAIDKSNSLFRLRHLQQLHLGSNNITGQLPESIGNLRELTSIYLAYCKFNGPIPKTLEKLTQLTYLDFSNNNFSGPVPPFTSLRNLTEVYLTNNQLNGSILSTNWSSLMNLESLYLSYNSFSGTVPPTLFQSQSLKKIYLSYNQFTGVFSEVKGEYSSLLETINLSHNRLQGPFPMFLFEIQGLKWLLLYRNKFSGLIPLSAFQKLKNLQRLDLSYNNLSIDTSYTNPLLPPPFPIIEKLDFGSCNFTKFPNFLKNLSSLFYLDLSNNRIPGEIPSWIWEIQPLQYLNLSLNYFVEFETPLNITQSMRSLDLHGNQLQWQKPILPPFASYVDYSNNNLSSVLPSEIGDFLQNAQFLSLSGNKIYGSIPESICNSQYLKVLDMSNNSLSGPIPECLIQMSGSLRVLNLKRNNLSGEISDMFPVNCTLGTLDLNRNQLGGKIPKSLAYCIMLEILDIGKNRIDDTFPCHLKSTSSLRVLVLRSNQFKGDVNCRGNNVTWPMLQIIDLASNSFSGKLPQELLMSWNDMKADTYPYGEQLQFDMPRFREIAFQYSVTVIMKSQELDLVKILTIFTSIDFSSNKFEGPIPDMIGDFRALYFLNLSHNALTGNIPPALGNMKQLESLDLSSNNLSGNIPPNLVELNFLAALNLSHNQLEGSIPTGKQFATFNNDSYEANKGLCGFPLTKNCKDANHDPDLESGTGSNQIDWNLISVEIGFVFGLGVSILPLMFWKRWRVWYYKRTDHVLYKIFPKLDRKNRYRGTIARWPQGRRQ